MSFRQTTWGDYLDEWEENPWKAVAFIQKLLLDSEIGKNDDVYWVQWEGMLLIQNKDALERFNVDIKTK